MAIRIAWNKSMLIVNVSFSLNVLKTQSILLNDL